MLHLRVVHKEDSGGERLAVEAAPSGAGLEAHFGTEVSSDQQLPLDPASDAAPCLGSGISPKRKRGCSPSSDMAKKRFHKMNQENSKAQRHFSSSSSWRRADHLPTPSGMWNGTGLSNCCLVPHQEQQRPIPSTLVLAMGHLSTVLTTSAPVPTPFQDYFASQSWTNCWLRSSLVLRL